MDDEGGVAGAGDAGSDGRLPSFFDQGGSADGGGGSDGGPGGNAEWQEFGTNGTRDGLEKSPEGYALCGLGDIRTDDLRGREETEVPDGPWSALPVPDETEGRCGDDEETALWRLSNCERLSRNLDPLRCDLRLVWVSRQHSHDMLDRGFFDHENPDGEQPWDRMEDRGIRFSWVGENIASYPDAESAHFGWMDSDGHRSNILDGNFSFMSIGSVQGGFGVMYTQSFIHP